MPLRMPRTTPYSQESLRDGGDDWDATRAKAQDEALERDGVFLGSPLGDEDYSRAAADVWLLDGKLYVTEDLDLTPGDVRALVNEQANRRRLRLEKAHAVQAMADQLSTRRQPLPRDVKILVWQRDGGRCVDCGSQKDLEFDHVIPLAMGGSNTARNIQLLCADCNRRKGATLG